MHILYITIDLRKYTDTEYSETTLVLSVLPITDSIISTFYVSHHSFLPGPFVLHQYLVP